MSNTTPELKAGSASFTAKAANYLDERTKIGVAVREFGRKVFPDHWSFLLGEVALYSFVVVLLSGTFLTLFFQASMVETHWDGPFAPMKGVEMSAAMASTLDISFSIRGGLLVRQLHHWAALLFVASIGLHMLRVFFTGAFRKPRELNWVVGFVLFILAMAEGFTGYSLPDDVLSGNGLRIIDGIMKAIPVVGTWLSYLFFGGEFPGTDIVGRLYMLHIMVLPAMVILFIALHLTFVVIHKHTQYPGPGRTQENVVGFPVLPVYAAKAGGFFFIVFGVLVLIAATFSINPIWNYGPYDPSPVSAGTQPDWYIGFADGALRLVPPGLETEWFGYTWSWNMLLPLLVIGIFFVLVACYPFIEAWVTGDKREHHILDRPRNAPTRTAIGAAGVTFYAALWAGASSDLMATHFQSSLEFMIHMLQFSLVFGPIIAFVITKRICLALQKKDRSIALHGWESARIVRLPGGKFTEVHEELSEHERWQLVSYHDYAPLIVRPDANGKISVGQKVRAAVSRFFFEDRIVPPTQTEIEQAKHDHH
ncbi:ubiquinol-cytochrome c reductase cytochrome b subunit [Leucobacter sp. OH2974_COT-288]|uniref:Cytochrome bc1 complex cytochrome b subunit n=1 Tax=Canibacter oris TaxID=1365628 RepID=A0A840DPB4_9MICO|nr:ubiquinol-cytochrome c reductase cytochrome b subunit [Canibacter oris]MBB4071868.1 ubiquinol-cytochrome c reductase cytochrome b subunit [Canibacter oris]RRD36274.1 ubiquinol-cytochrome c reductase cytochrome b subunit [Leucobacter sp. OH2974_COT-288]